MTSINTVNSYNLFLNSANRSSGSTSNYILSLFKPIILTSPNNYFTVRVGSVEVPYAFPLITNENNTITFSITRAGSTTNSSFTIDNGNYNILNLLDMISNALYNKIYTLIGVLLKFNFTYERVSGKATFSIVGADSIATSITINNNSPVFMTCIGFSAPFTFSYTTSTSSVNATSTQNVNVTQNVALYVRSDGLAQTSNYENIVTSSNMSNILAKVQLNTTPQSYILWTNPTDLEVEINNRIIDTIDLYLGTSTSYNLDLGNLNWSIRMTIHEKSRNGKEEQHIDRATNMTSLHPALTERQAIIDNLKNLKSKIISQ
jgi:hypothetical protein